MNPKTDTFETEVVEVGAVEAVTRGEIDIAIATARKYPRQPALIKSEMMTYATLDEETAAACFYTLPRGGKNIQGPSVRLAEIAVAAYGNVRVQCRVISTVAHGENPHVVVQAVAFDLQKNYAVSIEKRRRIMGKKNAGGAIGDDDINLAVNSGSAIAFRDAVFKVVPLALIKPVFEQCRKVAVGDAKSLVDRRTKMVEQFAKMGISKERIIAKLERKTVEEIDLSDIETLIGLFNSIRDGEMTHEEAFPALATTNKANAPAATGAPVPPTPPVMPAKAEPKPAAATQTPETVKDAGNQAVATAASPVGQAGTADIPAGEPQQEAKTAEQTQTGPECPAEDPADPLFVVNAVRAKATALGVSETQVMRYLQGIKPAGSFARGSQNSFDKLSEKKMPRIWKMLDDADVLKEIKDIDV